MRIHTRNARQYGFTLLEVLVTVIIMTIGMLGVAGLQLASMRSNHSAYLRTQATIAAYSLIDRMRADPAEFNGKRFNTTSGDTPQSFQNWVYDLERIGLQDNIGDAQGEDSDIVIGEVNCSDDDENICLEGNCQIIVRWNDSRGEAIELAEGARGSDKTESAAEFSVCTRIAQ